MPKCIPKSVPFGLWTRFSTPRFWAVGGAASSAPGTAQRANIFASNINLASPLKNKRQSNVVDRDPTPEFVTIYPSFYCAVGAVVWSPSPAVGVN